MTLQFNDDVKIKLIIQLMKINTAHLKIYI